jgi:uncharacterized membrane protein
LTQAQSLFKVTYNNKKENIFVFGIDSGFLSVGDFGIEVINLLTLKE